MSKKRTLSFVLAAILSPLGAMILGYYVFSIDALSVLVASGTVELALLAGLQDRIRGWLMAPKLDIGLSPADFHGTFDDGSRVYYSRFQVHNKGEASAEKVEVILQRVYRWQGERFLLDDSITPDNLVWSMIGQWETIPTQQYGVVNYARKFLPATYCDYIAPGTRKHCTLGHIYEPTHRANNEYEEPRFQAPPGETVFCLEVSFKTNLRNYILSKGTYGIELQVAASNAKATTKRFRIEVTGKWFPDDDKTMAREGFKIEEVKYDFDKYTEKVTSKQEIPSEAEAGTTDKEKPPAEATAGSQQPSASGEAERPFTDVEESRRLLDKIEELQQKKRNEEASKSQTDAEV